MRNRCRPSHVPVGRQRRSDDDCEMKRPNLLSLEARGVTRWGWGHSHQGYSANRVKVSTSTLQSVVNAVLRVGRALPRLDYSVDRSTRTL